ncbi:MAG: hypothetical protein JSR28_10750 [Proteobacteria bacterium]|nr:hypothetical protein [Pseudomonadota bacterium]
MTRAPDLLFHHIPSDVPTVSLVRKDELAAILGVTARSVSDYVARGELPTPKRLGRRAAWDIDELIALTPVTAKTGRLWSADRVARLKQHAAGLKLRAKQAEQERGPANLASGGGSAFPSGWLVEGEEAIDWRPTLFDENRFLRAQRKQLAEDFPTKADRGLEYWNEVRDITERIDNNEHHLSSFLARHTGGTFLGSSLLLTQPVFTSGNRMTPRAGLRELQLHSRDYGAYSCKGPELRQDDSLVFLLLIRLAQDARPGRAVGFSPGDFCKSVWKYDSGDARRRLRECIGRLQETRLSFETFTVQLVGRFDHPSRGPWSVALDRDIVRLFTGQLQVWLDVGKRLGYGAGLATQLYSYVCSQTTLIPTKVSRLHRELGSRASLKSFREELGHGLSVLSAGGDIDANWYIDRYDMVHWLKMARK